MNGEIGTAWGWFVQPRALGGYQWSAYGPTGGIIGVTDGEQEAASLARETLEDMKRNGRLRAPQTFFPQTT